MELHCAVWKMKFRWRSQGARQLFWLGHFLSSPNPYKWHADWLRAVLKDMKPICTFIKSVCHLKIACDVTWWFFELYFNTLCDAYTVYIQYTGLSKRIMNPTNLKE